MLQTVSQSVWFFLLVLLLLGLWILSNARLDDYRMLGKHGVYLIDFVDYLWFVENLVAAFKWTGQVRTITLSSRYIITEHYLTLYYRSRLTSWECISVEWWSRPYILTS